VYAWSGQTVNISKSNILFSKNISASTITAIRNILPYALTPATAKHLGLPILFGKSKTVAFTDLLEKKNKAKLKVGVQKLCLKQVKLF
jgi:hypothetical protein